MNGSDNPFEEIERKTNKPINKYYLENADEKYLNNNISGASIATIILTVMGFILGIYSLIPAIITGIISMFQFKKNPTKQGKTITLIAFIAAILLTLKILLFF